MLTGPDALDFLEGHLRALLNGLRAQAAGIDSTDPRFAAGLRWVAAVVEVDLLGRQPEKGGE